MGLVSSNNTARFLSQSSSIPIHLFQTTNHIVCLADYGLLSGILRLLTSLYFYNRSFHRLPFQEVVRRYFLLFIVRGMTISCTCSIMSFLAIKIADLNNLYSNRIFLSTTAESTSGP
ncbi:hypothetical protein PV328_000114 [Microctonus aethiopoides]|uniref:Uncharacterized protein n=1 Tax=Microctonus aethiopoides TaxID=144406 RepID=A0AA39FUW9_9HYME|nr:hypothetical protein PV328_000114 [Microctonus aethiopoides]